MYTLSRDTKITNEILNDAIHYNEQFKNRYDKLEDYYLGRQDIFNRRKEDRLKNNKVMINHAKYITDMSVGYLLGNPVDYQVGNKENNEKYDIEPIINAYDKQTINDLDTELAQDISIYGNQREYVYASENAEPKSCEIDNRNSMIIYDDTVEHNKLYGLIYRPIYKGESFSHYEILFLDKNTITTYNSYSKYLQQQGKKKPHMFGDVPIIEYKNNSRGIGDFEEVLSLIDAYNLLESDRVNDKEQLVDAILVMYGMDFTDEQAETLKESRMIAGVPTDGKIEYLVKTLQESDVDVLRKTLEKEIHKISMVPNMSDENFAGNSSGVAIRYKLLAFEQMTKNKERYMEKGLKERFKLYNNFLITNSKMEEIPNEQVDVIFTRNLPSNDYETSQMINNLADFVDKETLVGQLSFVKDASEIVELKKKEDEEELENNQINNEEYTTNEIPDTNDLIKDEQEDENIKTDIEDKNKKKVENNEE